MTHGERNPEIIAQPPSALRVIALSIGIEMDDARAIVRALAKAGYVVAPMEPTNGMFSAYIEALGCPSKKHETVIHNIGKARKRWKAMAGVGMAVAFSTRNLEAADVECPHCGTTSDAHNIMCLRPADRRAVANGENTSK